MAHNNVECATRADAIITNSDAERGALIARAEEKARRPIEHRMAARGHLFRCIVYRGSRGRVGRCIMGRDHGGPRLTGLRQASPAVGVFRLGLNGTGVPSRS